MPTATRRTDDGQAPWRWWLPWLLTVAAQVAAEVECVNTNLEIPDGTGVRVGQELAITSSGTIADVRVWVNIVHPWVGDLSAQLFRIDDPPSGALLFDRPGTDSTPLGCPGDNVAAWFRDDALLPAQDNCGDPHGLVEGPYRPRDPLRIFDNDEISGSWRLEVWDEQDGQLGHLFGWCLEWDLGLFVDGFESGDSRSWSASTP